MHLSDREIALTLFLASIAASLLLWFTEENLQLVTGCFIFINVIAISTLNKNVILSYKVNHVRGAKILRTLRLLPNSTETSMLVLTLTMLSFFAINGLWSNLLTDIDDEDALYRLIFLAHMSLGIGISIYHAFTTKMKTPLEDKILRFYLVMVLLGLSIYTYLYTLESKQLGYLLFAALNGIQIIALIWVIESEESLDTYVPLPSKEAKLFESILAVIVVAAGVFVGHYVLHVHWSIIFSSIILIWNWIQQFFEDRSIANKLA